MNKIKKLIPMMLLSSIFIDGSINLLAMDDIASSFSSRVYSAEEINQLYNGSIFNPGNLYNIICINSNDNFHLQTKPIFLYQKISMLAEANRMIDARIEELNNPKLIEKGEIQFEDPIEYRGDYTFESIMNALTVNLERSGEFNSFAKAIILYRLVEYLELKPIIKVIVYDEYKNGHDVPHYEAVMLFDNGESYPYVASKCMFNPIPYDGKDKNSVWDKMKSNPKQYNMKEYYLAIPAPNSNERPLIFEINPESNYPPLFSQSQSSGLLFAIRKGNLTLEKLKENKNFLCSEIDSELVEKIGKLNI